MAVALIDDDAARLVLESLCPFCFLSNNTMRTLAILPSAKGDATTHLSDMSASSDRPSGPVLGQINSPVVSSSSEEVEEGFPDDLEVNSTTRANLNPQRYNGGAVSHTSRRSWKRIFAMGRRGTVGEEAKETRRG